MSSIINLQDKVVQFDEVLLKEVEDSFILLNLKNNNYYGLDSVGHHCYLRLLESETIENAFEKLTEDFQVDADELKADLILLIGSLIEAEVVYLQTK